MSQDPGAAGAEPVPVDVEARFALVESRLEHPLSAEQAADVRQRIGRSIALGVKLRSFPLTNADEPEIALVPFRGGDR